MAIVQNMWPNGVRTLDDMRKFGQLIVGPTASLENYCDRLPVADMQDTFLVVSRGGCAQGTRLADLEICVPDMMAELTRYAQERGNSHRPEVTYQTGADTATKDSWYDTAQLSRSLCNCKINFGGEGQAKTRKNLNPDCQRWKTGIYFEAVFLNALTQNSLQATVGENAYLHKAFHALLNRNRHIQNHRIGWHDDSADSYASHDPIVGMSWGATGVLLIRSKDKWNNVEKVLVSLPGDVYMCGGLFQEKLEHAVPPLRDWHSILARHRKDLLPFEIDAMEDELRQQHVERIRYHINVRWHTYHKNCTNHWMPLRPAATSAVDSTQPPSVTETVRRLNLSEDGKGMIITGFFKLGTQPPVTAASQSQRSSTPPPWERLKAVEPLVGDTRTDRSQSSASSLVVPPPARVATTASVSTQTDEDGRMVLLEEVASDFTELMTGCFSNMDFWPEMLRMCQLAGSASQISAEKQCLGQCSLFLNSMEANLDKFEALLTKLDAGEREAHSGVIQKATSTLHQMQSALSDKHCLQEALDRLRTYGCYMFETIAATGDAQVRNATWLQKLTMSHQDCEILMTTLDIEALGKGDIVWRMPGDWTCTLTKPDGTRVPHTVPENEELYVRFFDIGLLSDKEIHRLHLRSDNKQLTQQSGEELAHELRDVMRRCMTHVRLLDFNRTGADQQTAESTNVATEAYSLHVWAGPNSKRQTYMNKQKKEHQQKRQQTVDNDWQYGDGWYGTSSWYSASSW